MCAVYNGNFPQQIEYPDSKVHGANMGPIWGRQGKEQNSPET